MTVSTGAILKGFHDQAAAMGMPAVASDFSIEIEGYESLWIVTKQCPWPVLSVEGEIEVPGPLGSRHLVPQQANYSFQGPIAFKETRGGAVEAALMDIIQNREALFNAKIYEGTPDRYLRYKYIEDCFIQVDPVDRDQESRAELLLLSGTLFGHYFGDVVQGNSTDYR
jgi:hypothetical protein